MILSWSNPILACFQLPSSDDKICKTFLIQKGLLVDNSFRAEIKVLSVFDFDGTLTRHDSFIPFCALPSVTVSSPAGWLNSLFLPCGV